MKTFNAANRPTSALHQGWTHPASDPFLTLEPFILIKQRVTIAARYWVGQWSVPGEQSVVGVRLYSTLSLTTEY